MMGLALFMQFNGIVSMFFVEIKTIILPFLIMFYIGLVLIAIYLLITLLNLCLLSY